MTAYSPRLHREATSARPHHVCSIAFAPHPECPAREARPRRKSVVAPRAKKNTGNHNDTIPTTAKYVKYTFSIMRSPRMSICAPIGVASFFFRAMCPSSPSSAIDPTVSTTAARFAQAPRPNKATAANPTTTRSAVTLFGVQLTRASPRASATLQPLTRLLKLTTLVTYQCAVGWHPSLASQIPSSVAFWLPRLACRTSKYSFGYGNNLAPQSGHPSQRPHSQRARLPIAGVNATSAQALAQFVGE